MHCAGCKAELKAGTIGGLCPVCLLDTALPENSAEESGNFNYDLIEEIGRGGMGVVYRAVQHNSQREVAVKMILAEQVATPGMRERFRAETEAVASLDHPHILPIYETGESGGTPFYSMKFARGGTLREVIAKFRGRPREAAQLVASISRAIHHAHQRGILHRDLKPGNILLGPDATPFVSDFGLAKWITRDQRLTIASSMLGTPHYMAPEQANGSSAALTTAADVYSLGAILYELLTGRPPFAGESPLETLRLAADTAPPRPRSLDAGVPRDLEVIALKCLSREPLHRYSSAGALAEDIERWLGGRTIQARPARTPERVWRWAKRNPALAVLSIALLALLMAIAIGSTVAAARLRFSNARALAAEHQAREELRSASLAQARATRLTGRMGQRFGTLAALKKAASVRPGADLRTEAFAALMLPDLKVERTWSDRHASNSPAAFDSILSRYVVESDTGALSLRRTRDQSEIARLSSPAGNPRVLYIAPFSADDSKIAARFANDTIRVYDAASGQMLFELNNRPVGSPARAFAYDFQFSSSGSELAVGLPGGGVSFHDAATGAETGRLAAETVPAVVALSGDDKKVALVGRKSADVEIYDRATGRLQQRLVHPSHIYHVAWRPDRSDELATSCNDDNLYLWDAASGRQLRSFKGHEGIPPLLAFYPTGKILASTSRDYSVRLWDVETGACLLNAHGVYGEPCMRFSADGQHLAIGSEGTRLSIGRVVLDTPCREFFRCDLSDWYSRVSGLSVSPDGRLLAISLRNAGFHIFSAESLAAIHDLPVAPGDSNTGCFTPRSDAFLFSRHKSGLWKSQITWNAKGLPDVARAELIDPRPGFLVTDVQGEPPVAALYNDTAGKFSLLPLADLAHPVDLPVKSRPAAAFLTPDGHIAATEDWEGEIKGESDARLWDAHSGQLIRRLQGGPNNSVRISPTGKLLLACGSGPGAGLWNLPDLSRGPKLETAGDDGWFLPGEKFIGILNNENLDLVRIADGTLIGSFPGDPTLAAAFAPTGQKMYLGFGTHFYEWDLAAVHRELQAIDLDWEDTGKERR